MASYRRGKEDTLPKVLFCGLTEENIPKLIVCDENQQKDESRACLGSCNLPTPANIPFQQPPPPPPQVQTACDSPINLMCEIRNKEQIIDNLQQTLCSFQCQMNCLNKQNEILREKMQQVTSTLDENAECGNDMDYVRNRMEKCNENTKTLKQQIVTLENSVKALWEELLALRAEKTKLRNNKKIAMVCPAAWCAPRPPPCGGK